MKKKRTTIQWRAGNGSMLLSVAIMVMGLIMMFLYNSSEAVPISTLMRLVPDADGKNKQIEVEVHAHGNFFFKDYSNGEDEFTVSRESCVEIKDNPGGIHVP